MLTTIRVRLTPRARRDEVAGLREDGAIRIRVSAPPVDGKANKALVKLLAKRLGVPRSAVEIVRGASSRDKVVAVEGLDEAGVSAALGLTEQLRIE